MKHLPAYLLASAFSLILISYQPVVNGGAGEVNAVALRDLGAAPEPSTYALMLGGLGFLVVLLRRKAVLFP